MDEIQQLEVALLGTPAAKMLDILLMATTSQPLCTPLSSKPVHTAITPATTSSMVVAHP